MLCSEHGDKVVLASFARVQFYDKTTSVLDGDEPRYEPYNRFSTNCGTNLSAMVEDFLASTCKGDDREALMNCRRRVEQLNETKQGGLQYYEISNTLMDEVLGDLECSAQYHKAVSQATK